MSSDPLPLDRDRAEAALEDDPVVAEVAYQDDASVPGLTRRARRGHRRTGSPRRSSRRTRTPPSRRRVSPPPVSPSVRRSVRAVLMLAAGVLLGGCGRGGPAAPAGPSPTASTPAPAGYGGENQFATAGVDPRVDTIIPQITWNDLVYSLAPNNVGTAGDEPAGTGTAPVTQTIAAPGVEKQQWVTLFFGVGATQPVSSMQGSQPVSSTCPGFDSAACTAKAELDTLGYPDQATEDFAHGASVGQYLTDLRIPVFLSQGQDDTLFNLREATTTYLGLKAQGNPVKMLWQQWGHSGGPVAGEADGASDVPRLFDDLRYSAWFAKYLRDDTAADTGPEFEYYAPWLANHGTSSTPTDAYLGAPSFPVGHAQTLFLSGGTPQGTGSLVPDRDTVTPGTADFAVAPTTTTSYTETSAVDQSQPVTDAPGTFAAFASPPLAGAADQVGSPTLTVNLVAPSFAASQGPPGGRLVVFAKLYDVAPGGGDHLGQSGGQPDPRHRRHEAGGHPPALGGAPLPGRGPPRGGPVQRRRRLQGQQHGRARPGRHRRDARQHARGAVHRRRRCRLYAGCAAHAARGRCAGPAPRRRPGGGGRRARPATPTRRRRGTRDRLERPGLREQVVEDGCPTLGFSGEALGHVSGLEGPGLPGGDLVQGVVDRVVAGIGQRDLAPPDGER